MDLWTLADLSTPWCIHVAATLRVADHIAAGHTRIDDLATACAADADSLHRVLRHLVLKGVFEEPEPDVFALNQLGRQLIDMRLGFDLDGFGGRMAGAWSTLLSAVRTGRPAYQEAFGRSFWDDLAAHPHIAADFDSLMGPVGHGTPDPEVLPNPDDWAKISTVVDVGGGTGSLLAEVLKAHPHLHGTLIELPGPIARSVEIFQAAGVQDRVNAVAQSFFEPLPAGADLYLLKSVLPDWPDAEALSILTRCSEAARPKGRIVFFSNTGPEDAASPELLMMVLVGGRDRTIEEYRGLAQRAGLEIHAVGRQPSGKYLVECRPADV
jgi:hypothetical protein